MIRGLTEYVNRVYLSNEYEVLRSFSMLHAGWECDDIVLLIKVRDNIYAIGTDHGSIVTLTKEALLDKAKQYTKALQETLSAVSKIQ